MHSDGARVNGETEQRLYALSARDGYKNKQIAQHLGIAETTVNFHIRNIVEKLQANDRTHALTIDFRRGLLELE